MNDLFEFGDTQPKSKKQEVLSDKDKIISLRATIHHHDTLYYNKAEPEITDAEYDIMFRELEILEKKHPELHDPNSPIHRVGGTILENFQPIQHALPMLSIDDYFSHEEIADFYNRISSAAGSKQVDLTIEPKIDGVAASILYRKGQLEYCATRGDGTRGDDVTANARTITALPITLKNAPDLLEVRGEIYISTADFKKLNETRIEKGEKLFANPRNAAAGTLKSLDTSEVRRRKLSFIAHGIGAYEGDQLESEDQFKNLLVQLGIPTNAPVWHASTYEEMIHAIKELDKKRHGLGYGTDGAVVKVNYFSLRDSLGATARAPRWAAAFKYPPEKQETRLLNITIQVGRTGTLTPVAELEPVHVSGTTVARATLHNEDEIQRKDIRIGDTVIIEKAGEIIPSVVEVITSKRPVDAKTFSLFDFLDGKCPSCGEEIHREEGFIAWKCINLTCPAQATNRITHFASRKALDLNGLGESVAVRLVETGLAKSPLDLFSLKHHELADLELEPAQLMDGSQSKPRKYGAKRAQGLVDSLEHAKTQMPLAKWIYALGIDLVGESAAREVSRLVPRIEDILMNDTILSIIELAKLKSKQQQISPRNKTNPPQSDLEKTQRTEQFEALKLEIHAIEETLSSYQVSSELGPAAAGSLLTFFRSKAGQLVLQSLSEQGISPQSDNYAPTATKTKDLTFSGKTFVITGTLSKPRPEFKKQIEVLGGKVSGAVSKNTHFLLCGENGGSKFDKAQSLGVTILNEQDFNLLLPE